MKFNIVYPSLIFLRNLKVLSIQKNQITNISFSKYINELMLSYSNGTNVFHDKNCYELQKQNEFVQRCPLEKLVMHGCILKDEGVQTLLNAIHRNPLIFENLKQLNLNANRMTEFSVNGII